MPSCCVEEEASHPELVLLLVLGLWWSRLLRGCLQPRPVRFASGCSSSGHSCSCTPLRLLHAQDGVPRLLALRLELAVVAHVPVVRLLLQHQARRVLLR